MFNFKIGDPVVIPYRLGWEEGVVQAKYKNCCLIILTNPSPKGRTRTTSEFEDRLIPASLDVIPSLMKLRKKAVELEEKAYQAGEILGNAASKALKKSARKTYQIGDSVIDPYNPNKAGIIRAKYQKQYLVSWEREDGGERIYYETARDILPAGSPEIAGLIDLQREEDELYKVSGELNDTEKALLEGVLEGSCLE